MYFSRDKCDKTWFISPLVESEMYVSVCIYIYVLHVLHTYITHETRILKIQCKNFKQRNKISSNDEIWSRTNKIRDSKFSLVKRKIFLPIPRI